MTGRRRIEGWDPEDERRWESGGRRVALRNLAVSVLCEHVSFSVWSVWSVLVLFMTPDIGFAFDPGAKFLLVVTPTLVGAALRLPYGWAMARIGGRDWTVFSTAILLVPALLAAWSIRRPDTPLWVFMIIAATAGLGGGTFASSMTNVAGLFPRRHQGWALGLNAGGGNLGVAAVQLVGLLVIATAGAAHPSYVAAAYLPLIVLAALLAAWRMDNVDHTRPARGGLREAAGNRHSWWISLLYVGTFGSFIGYGFAFGLVLQNQFGASALEAASYTFLGPLLGSAARPVGGALADRWGGARVTLASLLGLAAGTGALLLAASSRAAFVAGFIALFVLSGVGNGATYKMIPVVFARQAQDEVTAGGDAAAAFARARRLAGAAIGIAGAVGALGGVAVNLAFRAAYGSGDGTEAFVGFLGWYAVCVLIVAAVYLRREPGRPVRAAGRRDRAAARV